MKCGAHWRTRLILNIPADPARVLFFYLRIDKASHFSKLIYLALWL